MSFLLAGTKDTLYLLYHIRRNYARIYYPLVISFIIGLDIVYVIVDPQLYGPAYLSKAYIDEKITTRNGGTKKPR